MLPEALPALVYDMIINTDHVLLLLKTGSFCDVMVFPIMCLQTWLMCVFIMCVLNLVRVIKVAGKWNRQMVVDLDDD